MNAVEVGRMRTLIAFLRTLRREQFDFCAVRSEHACGTVGCAIGWSPEVFPELVGKVGAGDGLMAPFVFKWLPTGEGCDFGDVGSRLFGLSYRDAGYLFHPELQSEVSKLLPDVPPFASPGEVADMLEGFLGLVLAGKLVDKGIQLTGEVAA